jgi:hypothetical protein
MFWLGNSIENFFADSKCKVNFFSSFFSFSFEDIFSRLLSPTQSRLVHKSDHSKKKRKKIATSLLCPQISYSPATV